MGSAASAVQIVPELAKIAGHLTVLQRTANWIMPRGRKPYSANRRRLFRVFPPFLRGTQRMQRFMMGFVHQAATLGHKRMDDFEKRVIKFIEKTIPDEALRDALTPRSRYACKRGLISDGFYPALMRDNVELIPAGLKEVTPSGIVTENGREVDADVIVYCTGYRILDFDRFEVLGQRGLSLADAMGDAPQAHKGIARPGFPNYFFVAGPNGLVLNVPYFVTIERNVASIVALLKQKQASDAKTIAVKEDLHRSYNDWMDTQFALYSWGSPSCNSYYRNAAGHAPFLFPGDFKTYLQLHRESGLHEYDVA